MNDLQKLADQFFQRVIDRQQGLLGQEDRRHCPNKRPTPEQQVRWNQALEPSGTFHFGHKRLARTVLIAVLTAAALIVTAVAARNLLLVWFKSEHENFTQFSVGESPESTVASWDGAYLPQYVPEGYIMSDAVGNLDIREVEYANSEGGRFTFFQYHECANIRIDTETAVTATCQIGAENEGIFVNKDGLTTLYWSTANTAFSILYSQSDLADEEVVKIAESITPINKKETIPDEKKPR